jgi:phage/plasmid-like protein (TIGR03299 family)
MSAEVESMFSVREKPWHGLGTIIQEACNSEEALHLAGLDWEVQQKPVVYNGKETGYRFNIRSSDDTVLGVVGGRYKPVQNKNAFAFTDELIGGDVRYETAGSLASGKRVWMLAKMPDTKILDDVVEPYLCLTNGHDGFSSMKVCMTPVRVVCQNTLNMALNTAKRTWNVRHSGNIESKLAEAQHTLGLASKYMEGLAEEAEELYKIKISPKDFKELSQALFPMTDDMSRRKEESQYLLQCQLKNAWDMDDLGNIRGTGWGFMNAISDMTTHRPPARKTDNYQENMFIYTIDAPVILDQALKMLKERV